MIITKSQLEKLSGFIDQNKDFDFISLNLKDTVQIEKMNWRKYKKEQNNLILFLKAYQRLIRIVPDGDRSLAFCLLKENIHSAVQIGSFSRREFVQRCSKIFKTEGIGEAIYENALKKRSSVVVKYMDALQNNEPHIKATRIQ